MADNIFWHMILSSGSKRLNDNADNAFIDFTLPASLVRAAPALLFVAAKNVGGEKNFLTLNMERREVLSHALEKQTPFFVNELFPTDSCWTVQMHAIKPNQLKPGGNHLGIHARDRDGNIVRGDIDDFEVARTYLIYTASA